MRRLILTLTLLLTFAGLALAQEQSNPQPDRWRGLILDESTPEDAIRILGQPRSDKPNERLNVQHIENWLTRRRRERIFRRMEWRRPEGIDKAVLYFLDNRLVMIELDVKDGISPEGLANIYGVSFRPMVSSIDEGFRPRDFQRDQGQVYPRTFPVVYHMIAVSERSFVSAMIGNVPSFGGALARSMGIPDEAGSLPGKVELIQLVSRTLENRDGADVLR